MLKLRRRHGTTMSLSRSALLRIKQAQKKLILSGEKASGLKLKGMGQP
jgi:hypothetical protein